VSLRTHYVLFEIEYGGATHARRGRRTPKCVLSASWRRSGSATTPARAAFDRVLAGFVDDEEATRQLTLRCGEDMPT
jgi:hypothetical protein